MIVLIRIDNPRLSSLLLESADDARASANRVKNTLVIPLSVVTRF
jgi:hypothetical protein